MSVMFMSLNVLQGNVEEKTGRMFISIWTLVMPSLQVAFVSMQKIVGVMKQLRQQMPHRTWRVHVVLMKTKLRDGSITAKFERIRKGR